MVEFLKEILHRLYDVKGLIEWGGTILVCGIVFVETGLFVGFFLPGDSLLVTAGIFAALGHLKLSWLLILVTLCAIAGDQLGYWIGRRTGGALYRREESRFFKKSHLARAHAFYEKYGGKTIILARFVPVVRTFCPPVAGAAHMSYPRFLAFDIFGGFFWVWSMLLVGFMLGTKVQHVDRQLHWIIAVVIFLSLLPAIIQALRIHLQRERASLPPVEAGKD
jgi:membrane-associated protein